LDLVLILITILTLILPFVLIVSSTLVSSRVYLNMFRRLPYVIYLKLS
jgi:hypothetical protein